MRTNLKSPAHNYKSATLRGNIARHPAVSTATTPQVRAEHASQAIPPHHSPSAIPHTHKHSQPITEAIAPTIMPLSLQLPKEEKLAPPPHGSLLLLGGDPTSPEDTQVQSMTQIPPAPTEGSTTNNSILSAATHTCNEPLPSRPHKITAIPQNPTKLRRQTHNPKLCTLAPDQAKLRQSHSQTRLSHLPTPSSRSQLGTPAPHQAKLQQSHSQTRLSHMPTPSSRSQTYNHEHNSVTRQQNITRINNLSHTQTRHPYTNNKTIILVKPQQQSSDTSPHRTILFYSESATPNPVGLGTAPYSSLPPAHNIPHVPLHLTMTVPNHTSTNTGQLTPQNIPNTHLSTKPLVIHNAATGHTHIKQQPLLSYPNRHTGSETYPNPPPITPLSKAHPGTKTPEPPRSQTSPSSPRVLTTRLPTTTSTTRHGNNPPSHQTTPPTPKQHTPNTQRGGGQPVDTPTQLQEHIHNNNTTNTYSPKTQTLQTATNHTLTSLQ